MPDEIKNEEKQNNAGGSVLVNEIEELKAKCEEYLNGWKRAKADYLNLKKETEEKQKSFAEFANAALLVQILPIHDNLKKALQALPAEPNNWVEGIKQIKKQLEDLLKIYGIEEVKTVGEKFNPQWHEAFGKEKKEGVDSDIIISELSSGYLMNGKSLLAAKVIVAE